MEFHIIKIFSIFKCLENFIANMCDYFSFFSYKGRVSCVKGT